MVCESQNSYPKTVEKLPGYKIQELQHPPLCSRCFRDIALLEGADARRAEDEGLLGAHRDPDDLPLVTDGGADQEVLPRGFQAHRAHCTAAGDLPWNQPFKALSS